MYIGKMSPCPQHLCELTSQSPVVLGLLYQQPWEQGNIPGATHPTGAVHVVLQIPGLTKTSKSRRNAPDPNVVPQRQRIWPLDTSQSRRRLDKFLLGQKSRTLVVYQ